MLIFLRALPLVWQLGIGAALIAGVGVTYGAWHHKVFQSGVRYEQARIERVNKKATDNARELKQNSDACDDAGGNWRQSLGLCQ